MSDFVHLHVHSEYSLLDGLPHPKALAARASELQQPALALTDHGTLFAAIEFYDACKAKGVKPIIGIEAYLAKRSMKDRDSKEDRSSYHLLLLAENDEGYHNLMKLASAAQLEGYYYYPRVDKALLEKHSAGVICTTGCPSGEIPRLLHDGRQEEARRAMAWYRDVFKDRFYVELQEHGIAEFTGLAKELVAVAREFNLPLVATNDAHYLRPEDASAQDILLCIQTNTVVTDPKRMRMDGSDYYLKSTEEMRQVWQEFPEALSNTVAVAERCQVDLDFKEYHLPIFPVPEGFTAESYLRQLCEEGYKQRYPEPTAESRARLDYELGVIHRMGFDTYFLIVWDLTRAAREKDIWFNVRGSAAGSMVAYCLRITSLDPLKHRLIFERFLNPGRITMPDIDLDFPDDRRQELIEYTVQKYGRSNVAQIVTFGTLGAKAAIRDVGRALDYPLNEVDQVAKLVPTGPHVKIDESLEKVPEFRHVYDTNDYLRKLIDNAKALEGVARHASTHAAGVVVADRAISEYAPLHRPTRGDETTGFPVTQFEMGILERIGLLKIDFLGLATLSIMRRACDLIKQRHGRELNLSNIPVEDPKAFDLLSRGDVTGVFQVEGAGLRGVLTRMKPNRFDHIVAAISLYRPGPMDKIPNYIDRLHGVEKVVYDHPKLEPILDETYGIVVYQEQILRMAMDLAGYTASEADLLRKAVGKKDKEKLLKERERFVEGCQKSGGIPKPVAEKLFDDLEFFARYGFNKAHGADYAVLTCQTAYLKAHYPIEYMTALMTTEIGNIEKVGLLVGEVRRMGIDVIAPDVNTSEAVFSIAPAGNAVFFALSAIKNVGNGPVEVILRARQSGGPFKSLDDFCRRVDLRLINRRVLESLIKAGALDRFGRRSQLLKILDRMMAASQSAHQASDRGQLSMFGSLGAAPGGAMDTFGTLADEPELPNRQRLADEKELTGTFFSDHPLQQLTKHRDPKATHMVEELDETVAGNMVMLTGVVNGARVIMTKKSEPMAFVQFEDPTGPIEITVFPKVFARTRELWQPDALLSVKGKVEVREGKVKLLCESAGVYQVKETATDLSSDLALANGNMSMTQPAAGAAQPSEPPEQPPTVQVAMPDETEAAIAESAERVESSNVAAEGYEIESGPPPPEEPPDDLLAAPPIIRADDRAVDSVMSVYTIKPQPSPVRHLRIYLERMDDHDEEVRRMRELLALLRSVRGQDRFTFFVPNPQGTVQLDFPNFTTSYIALGKALDDMVREWGELEVQDPSNVT